MIEKSGMVIPSDLKSVLQMMDDDGSGEIGFTEFIAASLDNKDYSDEELCWAGLLLVECEGRFLPHLLVDSVGV